MFRVSTSIKCLVLIFSLLSLLGGVSSSPLKEGRSANNNDRLIQRYELDEESLRKTSAQNAGIQDLVLSLCQLEEIKTTEYLTINYYSSQKLKDFLPEQSKNLRIYTIGQPLYIEYETIDNKKVTLSYCDSRLGTVVRDLDSGFIESDIDGVLDSYFIQDREERITLPLVWENNELRIDRELLRGQSVELQYAGFTN